MYAKYKLNDGSEISVFLWQDMLDGNTHRKSTTCYRVSEDGSIDTFMVKNIDIKGHESKRLYFEFNNEKVYFNDFIFMSVSELKEKIEEKAEVEDYEVWATLLKDTNNIGFLLVPTKKTRGFNNNDFDVDALDDEILYVPTEKYQRKDKWHYNLTLEADSEILRSRFVPEEQFFTSLLSKIKNGTIELVNKNVYKKIQSGELQYFLQYDVGVDSSSYYVKEELLYPGIKDMDLEDDVIGFSIIAHYLNPVINEMEYNEVIRCIIGGKYNSCNLTDEDIVATDLYELNGLYKELISRYVGKTKIKKV